MEEQNTNNNSESGVDSVSAFNIDEYGDIVFAMPPAVTESQLSTLTIYDEDETQKPGSLY